MKKLNKILTYVFIVLAVLVAIFFIVTALTENKVRKNSEDVTGLLENKSKKEKNENLFVVSGEFICLPVKDGILPHDDLCVFGIKGENDDYYRLQSIGDDEHNVVSQLKEGQKIEISGIFINEESDIYKTLGTIKISAVKILDLEYNGRNANLPISFRADYISFQDYSTGVFKVENYLMPGFTIINGEISCEETSPELSFGVRTAKKEINSKKYCIMASSEGAAGSVYTEYAYSTVIEDNVYLVQFVARYSNCYNYPDEEIIKCTTERENFNLDILVDKEIEKMKK